MVLLSFSRIASPQWSRSYENVNRLPSRIDPTNTPEIVVASVRDVLLYLAISNFLPLRKHKPILRTISLPDPVAYIHQAKSFFLPRGSVAFRREGGTKFITRTCSRLLQTCEYPVARAEGSFVASTRALAGHRMVATVNRSRIFPYTNGRYSRSRLLMIFLTNLSLNLYIYIESQPPSQPSSQVWSLSSPQWSSRQSSC